MSEVNKKLIEEEHEEEHMSGSEYLKSFTYGGLDGILSSLGVVMAGHAIDMEPRRIFVFGITAVIANAFGMGLGDFASSKSEKEFIFKEREREHWEIKNNLEGEKKEMVDIYVEKGILEEDAVKIVDKLADYEQLFLNVMMLEELGYNIDDSSPAKNGFITFLAFLVLGFLPIIPYVVARATEDEGNDKVYFWSASGVGALLLFALGAGKSYFGITKWYYSAFETLLVGAVATAVGYGFGLLFDLTGA